MLQHLLVIIIFALCLWIVIRRIIRMVRRARNNDARCLTCSETNCPLRHTHESNQCTCGDTETGKSDEKSIYCKKE